MEYIHTSCEITKNHLLRNGIDEKKIIIIPIGIEVADFAPYDREIKIKLRDRNEIPKDSFVIGSFQKDGNGWGEGEEPKLIKGPDIFCDTLEKISKNSNIFVVLTGPSRGYVKKRLEDLNIKYKHFYLNDYKKINEYYNLLDLYIVSSRLEGGPRALLESQAAGVPIVSTRVGMADDVITDGINGFLVDDLGVGGLVKKCEDLINNNTLRELFVNNGLKSVKRYDYKIIAQEYYDKIYKKLL